MIGTAVLHLLVALLGQSAAAQAPEPKEAADERLAFMKGSLASFDVTDGADGSATYRLDRDPVMRFNNPLGDVKDGTIFLWRGPGGRPEAAVQVFWHNDGRWFQEFSSLSPLPVRAGNIWRVRKGGIDLRPIPGAPEPADTAEQRSRQLRALAGEFSADEKLRAQTWQSLRLLTKPLARYGDPQGPVLDGALFAFVLTTDPEIYLVIEARQGPTGPEWQYGLAPSGVDPLRVRCNNTEVWSLPSRQAWLDPTAPYYVLNFARGTARPGGADTKGVGP